MIAFDNYLLLIDAKYQAETEKYQTQKNHKLGATGSR